jgi:capsular exopolysaccharide synthesis family protein
MSTKVLKRLKGGVLPDRKQWAPTLIFGREDTQTTIAESFRILRAAVSLLGPSNERKVTLVTSALPSEGKTTVASNLACAMAEEGKKVVIVDLDLRKPSLHKGFGFAKDEKSGTVDILSANANPQDCVITETGLPRLHLFLSGNKAPNPGELLNSNLVTKFIDLLRKNYDHVIIDSAPILAVADSRLISPMVDNFLFVVRAESTPKGAVDSALEILEGDGKRPSGLILNDFLDRRLNSGKKYRYGYYRSDKYSYGSYGSDED